MNLAHTHWEIICEVYWVYSIAHTINHSFLYLLTPPIVFCCHCSLWVLFFVLFSRKMKSTEIWSSDISENILVQALGHRTCDQKSITQFSSQLYQLNRRWLEKPCHPLSGICTNVETSTFPFLLQVFWEEEKQKLT